MHLLDMNHILATAMLQMYDSWVEAVDKKDISGAFLVDISVAFDVVDPDQLLANLLPLVVSILLLVRSPYQVFGPARWRLEGCENSCDVSLASARQPFIVFF